MADITTLMILSRKCCQTPNICGILSALFRGRCRNLLGHVEVVLVASLQILLKLRVLHLSLLREEIAKGGETVLALERVHRVGWLLAIELQARLALGGPARVITAAPLSIAMVPRQLRHKETSNRRVKVVSHVSTPPSACLPRDSWLSNIICTLDARRTRASSLVILPISIHKLIYRVLYHNPNVDLLTDVAASIIHRARLLLLRTHSVP